MKETAREINEAVALGKETEAGINEARRAVPGLQLQSVVQPEPCQLGQRTRRLVLRVAWLTDKRKGVVGCATFRSMRSWRGGSFR